MRVLSKLDQLEGYCREIVEAAPASFESYARHRLHRLAMERLLQVAIECILDVEELFVTGLRLGLPADTGGLSRRLVDAGVLPEVDAVLLRRIHAFRNVLVHRYGALDDELVFANLQKAPHDFRQLSRSFRIALDAFSSK